MTSSPHRAVIWTKDWPHNLPKATIRKLCDRCTMLTCCDRASGCLLRKEVAARDLTLRRANLERTRATRRASYARCAESTSAKRHWDYFHNRASVCKNRRDYYALNRVRILQRIRDRRAAKTSVQENGSAPQTK